MDEEVKHSETAPQVKRAVGYVRVSTTEQAEKGYSIDAQIATIKQYARQHNFNITHMYVDRGVSGKSIKGRLQMQQLLLDAKEGLFDAVIIWKTSRMARNLGDLMNFIDVFEKQSVAFYSITERFEIEHATGRMMLQIMAAFNEFERNNIAENVKLGMKRRAREGYPNVGAVIGYEPSIDKQGKRNLAIVDDEAHIVQRIFTLCAMGNGYRAIANTLNQAGYRTKRQQPFSTLAVKDILHNPLYVGRVRYNRYEDWDKRRRRGRSDTANVIDVAGRHPAIIDQDLWTAAQNHLREASIQPEWNRKGLNVLTGLLRCPECGGSMVASNTTNRLKDGTQKRIRYYSCANFRNKGATVCHANSIRADEIEAMVAARLQQVMHDPAIAQGVVDNLISNQQDISSGYDQQIQLANRQLEQVANKIARMDVLVEEEPELAKEVHFRRANLQDEVDELQAEVARLSRQVAEAHELPKLATVDWLLRLVAEMCRGKDAKALKELYKVFIHKINFNKKKQLIYVTMDIDQSVVEQLRQAKGDAEWHHPILVRQVRLIV